MTSAEATALQTLARLARAVDDLLAATGPAILAIPHDGLAVALTLAGRSAVAAYEADIADAILAEYGVETR